MNRRRDRRVLGIMLTASAVVMGGVGFALMEPTHPPQAMGGALPAVDAGRVPGAPTLATSEAELRRRFDAAVVLLHAKQYENAATALQQVLELSPRMPEAHVNLGFAMLGLKRPAVARTHFESATALKADQANAYYGLALAYEAGGDIELALGSMRSYLHLARGEDEAHLRRARSAVWEWETKVAAARAAPNLSLGADPSAEPKR